MKIVSKKDKVVISFGDTMWETIRRNPKMLLHVGNLVTRVVLYAVFVLLSLMTLTALVAQEPDSPSVFMMWMIIFVVALPFAWCMLGSPSVHRLCFKKNKFLCHSRFGIFSCKFDRTSLSDISMYDFQRYEGRITLVLLGKISIPRGWLRRRVYIPITEEGVVQVICDYLRKYGYGDRIKGLHDVNEEPKASFWLDTIF